MSIRPTCGKNVLYSFGCVSCYDSFKRQGFLQLWTPSVSASRNRVTCPKSDPHVTKSLHQGRSSKQSQCWEGTLFHQDGGRAAALAQKGATGGLASRKGWKGTWAGTRKIERHWHVVWQATQERTVTEVRWGRSFGSQRWPVKPCEHSQKPCWPLMMRSWRRMGRGNIVKCWWTPGCRGSGSATWARCLWLDHV